MARELDIPAKRIHKFIRDGRIEATDGMLVDFVGRTNILNACSMMDSNNSTEKQVFVKMNIRKR